ncbi:hypothetical protein G7054_g4622 [Neopestalotiopsis clavispora]|nr:hypothetical protein G7054_g4622 [Neopestalotiopsis clavispora]
MTSISTLRPPVQDVVGTRYGERVVRGDQTSKAALTVIPAGLDGGLHHAEPQWVYFVTGLAHMTLPLSSDQAWINGGKYGLLWAGDGANVSRLGHRTFYSEQSVLSACLPGASRRTRLFGKVPVCRRMF